MSRERHDTTQVEVPLARVTREVITSRWMALPQSGRLAEIVTDLAADPDVVAIWLAGSLARGAGDPHSDVDLCLAVRADTYVADVLPPSAGRLAAAAVTQLPFHFGGEATLWHMMLEDGTIYDLHVQPDDEAPPRGIKLALACRDDAFGDKLTGSEGPPLEFPPARGEEIARVLQFFWMSQRKHQKALYRQLPLMAWQGEVLSRQDLVRFWYILATGNDCGPLHRLTIHTLTPVVKAVQAHVGPDALALVGQPTRTPAELVAAMTRLHDAVARAGRALADQLGFDYPAAAEETARRTWQEFLAEECKSTNRQINKSANQQINKSANRQIADDV